MFKHLRKHSNSERGLTLIEVLAAITIGTIVIGLSFSVLISSINSFKKTEGKQILQQEANLILTQLRTIHRTQSTYLITYDETYNQYKVVLSDNSTQTLGNPNYMIQLTVDNVIITEVNPQQIDSTRNDYNLRLEISDPATNNEFSIKSGITRL